MNEEKKVHKRKLLIRYTLLAVCILVIAAVTVVSVFAANDWFIEELAETNAPAEEKPEQKPEQKPEEKPEQKPDAPVDSVTTFAMPVADMQVINGCDFGPDSSLSGCYHFHVGMDVSAAVGTPVMVCLAGTVESVTGGDRLDGTTLTVAHDNGLKTVYRYIDVNDDVTVGSKVERGQTVGTVAEPDGAEYKSGPHLHFEVYENGKWADPADFLDADSK